MSNIVNAITHLARCLILDQIVCRTGNQRRIISPEKWIEQLIFINKLGGCPLRGKSSMCMMCLNYRIILLIVIKNPWFILLAYFWLGRIQRPSDPSTFPHSALHLPFRHLAINLICHREVATSILLMWKLQRKHRKMWRNYLWFFFIKNKGQTQKAVA